MAEISPFCGIRYDEDLVKDLASVICPPYDIITAQMQQELYQRSEHNFVRLEFGRELPQDGDAENKYSRATAILKEWLADGILKTDDKPAIYLHDHYFTHRDERYCRRNMVCLVKLEEWERMVVRPHEGTLTRPKGDRLSLLWALQANTSPILSLFEDSRQRVAPLLASVARQSPVIDFAAGSGEHHRLWAITDSGVINRICRSFTGQPLYIADGHHRYESALAYQRERRACFPDASALEPFDFVMMSLVEFTDPGLVILPAHRLIRGVPKSVLDGLRDKLAAFFTIEELPLETGSGQQLFGKLLPQDTGDVRIVLFGLKKEHVFVLRLSDAHAVSQMMPYFHSDLYNRLSISVLDHVILEELLGLSHEGVEGDIEYSYDEADAVNRVLDQEYQLAFLLSPVQPTLVKAIADTGDRMPRKSTYFYPKPPAGLVFHRLV